MAITHVTLNSVLERNNVECRTVFQKGSNLIALARERHTGERNPRENWIGVGAYLDQCPTLTELGMVRDISPNPLVGRMDKAIERRESKQGRKRWQRVTAEIVKGRGMGAEGVPIFFIQYCCSQHHRQ